MKFQIGDYVSKSVCVENVVVELKGKITNIINGKYLVAVEIPNTIGKGLMLVSGNQLTTASPPP